jgi:hypothetical protein
MKKTINIIYFSIYNCIIGSLNFYYSNNNNKNTIKLNNDFIKYNDQYKRDIDYIIKIKTK